MRKFDPLKADHPLVGDQCPVCEKHFVKGDEVTLVPLWPADPEEAKKAQQGRVFNAVAKAVHWDCRGN